MPLETEPYICTVSKETSFLISEPDKVLLSKLSTINRDVTQTCSASNANESDKAPVWRNHSNSSTENHLPSSLSYL